jgi:ribonuclease P protein component
VNASVPARSKQSAGVRRGPATFPRRARLLRHADFSRVYKRGRRHFSASLTVFYLPRKIAEPHSVGPSDTKCNTEPKNLALGFRVGFTVGRALGGAVERNRMKRRLREAVRMSWPAQAPDADIVINPKKTVLKVEFETLLNEVRRAFAVIEEKLGSASDFASKADKDAPEARK